MQIHFLGLMIRGGSMDISFGQSTVTKNVTYPRR